MSLYAFEKFAQIAADWVWETDQDGRLSYLSADAESFFGRAPSELVGMGYAALAHDGQGASPVAYSDALDTCQAFRSITFAYCHPDGAQRWFELSGRPRFSAQERFLGYHGVGSDISDQHRTRDALVNALAQVRKSNDQLTEQNRRFDAALENMTQGLCMFDASAGLVVWNRRYLDMYGLDDSDLYVGMSQRAILERLMALGRYWPGATVDSLSEGTRTSLNSEGINAVLRELADGRAIAVTHRPMTGGGWVATFEDVTERRRNEARIAHMARHDALTDLPNRTALRELCATLMAELAGSCLSVLCLDLDRFKPVNDSFGHAVGDMLLRAVAERLRQQVRGRDVVARLGGDEFAVLHGAEDAAGAVAMAERLIQVIGRPYDLDGLRVEVGMSIGIALAQGEGRDIDRLLKNADTALYEAKGSGRGTHCLFEPRMDAAARERLLLERELREALAEGLFELHYQPLVDLADSRINGLEALVRWRHADRGLISPAVFIPVAEESGLIVPLGEWVLNQACRDAAGWPDDVSIAVNVSPLQLRQRGFTQTVLSALARSGLRADRLELEITENVLLDDTEANLETLHTLRRLGVRISMDDFGTGYSSISYLRRFPFDKIKIDRSFARDAGTSPEASAIIRAIVGLGASLGITTLVEGIETQAQLAAVRAEGAQEMQGFLFSPPRPARDINTMLASSMTGNEIAFA